MGETFLAVAFFCAGNPSPSPAIADRTEESSLNKLLKTWEVQSHRGKIVQIGFRRYVYDHVSLQERRSEGRLFFGEGKFRADFQASEYEKGEKSQRNDFRTQRPFRLERGRSETWIGDPKKIRYVLHETRGIEVFPIPKSRQNVAVDQKSKDLRADSPFHLPSFWDDYVPTFLRVNAANLKRRFFIHSEEDSARNIVFTMVPRGEPESFYWKSLSVMWDEAHQRVGALRIVDSSGNLETVYVVMDYQVDPKLDPKEIWNPRFPDYTDRVHEAE